MKKNLPFLLIGLFLICVVILDAIEIPAPSPAPSTLPAAEDTLPPTTQPPTEATLPSATTEPATVPTTVPAETEAPAAPEGYLSFNTYDITFLTPGDSWEVYNGTLQKEFVFFSSDNTSVATFENGVVTAVGGGTTYIHASFGGESIRCIIRNVFEGDIHSRAPVLSPPEASEGIAEFYDDAVFVGDSVSLMLSSYAAETGLLGNAQFLVRSSYSVIHAVNNTMLMYFRGEQLPLPEAIAGCGAKKVFIMLGMNDIGAYGISKTMERWEIMLSQIRERNPDVEIYIQSMTPVYTGGENGALNNPNTDSYNKQLVAFAEENGCVYLDIASYMKDSTGGLAEVYCSDEYVHLTRAAAETWIKVLIAFAEQQTEVIP